MNNMKKKLYSKFKFIKFSEQLEALKTKKIVAPVHVRIKPINACNHDCWYCAYHVDWLSVGSQMEYNDVLPNEKLFEIANDVIEMGVKAVTFSGGGEPLLHPKITECIEILGKAGIKVAALTNGTNIKGKVADALANYGSWVRISMDGWDGPSYAKARNIKEDEFGKVMENIRKFAERKSACVIGVSFIVEENNFEHLFEFASLVKEAGGNHVSFSGCVIANTSKEINEYHDKYKARVSEEINRAKLLVGEDFDVIDSYHNLGDRFDKDYHSCPFMQFQTIIGADSKVYTCHDKVYTDEGLLGSIENQSFKDFWFSEENRRKIQGLDPSRDCPHHCVADKRNQLILDYLNTDERHIEFV